MLELECGESIMRSCAFQLSRFSTELDDFVRDVWELQRNGELHPYVEFAATMYNEDSEALNVDDKLATKLDRRMSSFESAWFRKCVVQQVSARSSFDCPCIDGLLLDKDGVKKVDKLFCYNEMWFESKYSGSRGPAPAMLRYL